MALIVLPVVGALFVAGALWLLHSPPEEIGPTTVSGTVTGRYGVVWNVRITAEAGKTLLAETWTNPNGKYSLEVPPNVPFVLSALPISITYLIDEHRPLTLRRGEHRTVSFDLETIPVTTGTVVGDGIAPGLALVAVREDGKDRRRASAPLKDASFTFWPLAKGAAYRLEVPWGYALERPVVFRAGDSGIVAPLRRMLGVSLYVREVASGKDIRAFTVKVISPRGDIFATVEGKDGHLLRQVPHPDPLGSQTGSWTFVVSADGYLDERTRGWFVFLQRARAPNITLLVRLADGTPYEGDIAAYGLPINGFGGTDARPTKVAPGRFAATLPPGRWRIRVDPGPAFEEPRWDVTVPEAGVLTVDVPPLTPRTTPERR